MALVVSPFGTLWLITAYSQQVSHFFVLLSILEKDSTRARDSSSSRFSGLGRSASVAGSCVCACSCLPLSPRGASPLFPQREPEVRASRSLALDVFLSMFVAHIEGGQRGQSKRTKLVTPKSSQGTVREWSAELFILTVHVVHIAHSHMHTSTFCCAQGRFQVFLVNTEQVNRLPVWHREIKISLFYSLLFSAELSYTLFDSSYRAFGCAYGYVDNQSS